MTKPVPRKKTRRKTFKAGALNPGSAASRAAGSGAGRKKGTPNKFSRDIKTAILNAVEQLGGDQFFVKLGKNQRTRSVLAQGAFKLIPVQIHGDSAGSVDERAAELRTRMAAMEEATTGPKKK